MLWPLKFKKKPIVIEAIQNNNSGSGQVMSQQWGENFDNQVVWNDDNSLHSIITLEGEMLVDQGDWVIKGVAGEFYPCKPLIFEASYEAVM